MAKLERSLASAVRVNEALREQLASRDAEVAELRKQLAATEDKYLVERGMRRLNSGEAESLRQQLAIRDAEVSELRKQVTLLRDALREIQMVSESSVKTHGYDKQHVRNADVAKRALAATDPGSTHQDKSALFKSLGLVPWDNKPPACTDMVWIEPGKIDAKVAKAPK